MLKIPEGPRRVVGRLGLVDSESCVRVWEGFREVLKLPESGASRFIEWIVETSQKIFCDPHVGYRLCLDSLVTTSRQRILYEKVKLQWFNTES